MKFIPLKEALGILAVSRSEFYRRKSTDPNFPKPVRPLGVGSKRIALVDSEIEEYQNRRIAERDDNTQP